MHTTISCVFYTGYSDMFPVPVNLILFCVKTYIIFYKLTASITYILCILQAFIIIPHTILDSKTISSSYTYTNCIQHTHGGIPGSF